MEDKTNFQGIHQYEFADDNKYVWFDLEGVLKLTKLTERDLQQVPEEYRNIRELIDGTKVIQEPGAYFLILFVSKSRKSQQMQEWFMNKVLPDIETKGYYIKGE